MAHDFQFERDQTFGEWLIRSFTKRLLLKMPPGRLIVFIAWKTVSRPARTGGGAAYNGNCSASLAHVGLHARDGRVVFFREQRCR